MGIVFDHPDDDQIEVTIFGPGVGECCLIHLGSRRWIVIDSCRGSDGRPRALSYLEKIGADVANEVELIIATHWHDDHIGGLAELVQKCSRARFCASAALRQQEFLANIAVYDERHNIKGGSGVSEIFAVLEVLGNTTRVAIPALANKVVFRQISKDLAHGMDCEIWTLSPSDKQFRLSLEEISKLVPLTMLSKRRFPNQSPNMLAIVTLIKFEKIGILLGADLEEKAHPELGWSAIVNSSEWPRVRSRIFKIPHHGSITSHCDAVWSEILDKEVISVATPYNAGKKPLPSSEDIERIAARSGRFFITSRKQGKGTPKRAADVEKMIKEVGNLISLYSRDGVVRVRNGGRSAPEDWRVELSDEAVDAMK